MAQVKESERVELAYLYDKGYDWIVGIVFRWVHTLKDASLTGSPDRHGDGEFDD